MIYRLLAFFHFPAPFAQFLFSCTPHAQVVSRHRIINEFTLTRDAISFVDGLSQREPLLPGSRPLALTAARPGHARLPEMPGRFDVARFMIAVMPSGMLLLMIFADIMH